MAKLWAGRFGKETDLEVNDFNSSISFDCRLYKEDITGSMAHAAMLGKQGIIAQDEADRIIEGLKGILGIVISKFAVIIVLCYKKRQGRMKFAKVFV